MTAQKTPDEVAKEFVDHHTLCDGEPHCPPYCNYQKFKRALAQAIRDAREAAIDECAATVECPSCENRSDSIYVNAHDVMNKIRALKKGKV